MKIDTLECRLRIDRMKNNKNLIYMFLKLDFLIHFCKILDIENRHVATSMSSVLQKC